MKLSLIPAPTKIEYANGVADINCEVIKNIVPFADSEEFEIKIRKTVEITAGGEAGLYYASLLLEQIKYQCKDSLPYLTVKDSPRYKYRAFMIDCCRHFFSVDDLKTMISHCALMRFNVFHWHLTDDQGFRIDIKKYPALTEKGSVRHGTHLGSEQNNYDYGGFYTAEQIREIVLFAHAHHMTVVPEIDMPGHASAMLCAIPQLVCGNKNVNVKTSAGIFKDIICAGNEESLRIIFDILDEVCELFPDEYIHLGGDEAPKKQWKSCPLCNKKIEEGHLSGYEALQGYFINSVADYLEKKGKKVITWNESLKSGILKESVTVQQWMDMKHLSEKCKNKVIVSDFYHRYADYPYAMTPLKKVYEYDTDIKDGVMGTDIPIWTEYIGTLDHMEYMCFPRFIACAHSAWSGNSIPYNDFKKDLIKLLPWFDIKGCAREAEWDPKALTRLPKVIKHFYSLRKRK